VSINSSSSTAAGNTPNFSTTNLDNPVAAAPPDVQASSEPIQSTVATLTLSSDLPIESSTPVGAVTDSRTDMSLSLDRAEEAMDTVKTWKSTIETIKQVMDIVGSIVKVWLARYSLHFAELICSPQLNSQASSAWTLLSKIPEVCILAFSEYMKHPFTLATRLC
jgi:hypothetical protein